MKEKGKKTSYISPDKVAGAVILYNSKVDVIENISTYIQQVNRLYVIDNSDVKNYELINELNSIPSINYISNNGNQGIANALNVAANQAIQQGFSFLLTMDDDSKAPYDMIDRLSCFVNEYIDPARIGIVSVAHKYSNSPDVYNKVNFTMTSGNLLNLNAFKQVGGFNENLFIDYVDHEYNLRLLLDNYLIYEIKDLKLNHRLGAMKKTKLFFINIDYISHSPKRLYYLFRNSIYIFRTYIYIRPDLCLEIFWPTFKEVTKSIILEDQKGIRISYLWKALKDGFKGSLGKLVQ